MRDPGNNVEGTGYEREEDETELTAQEVFQPPSPEEKEVEEEEFMEGDGEEKETSGKEADLGTAIARMMKNPEMKKFIREQQMVQIDLMYGDLFDELGLSTNEADTFKKLILDKMMSGMDQAFSILEGKADKDKFKGIKEEIEH